MNQTPFKPNIGDYYWVALSPTKVFGTHYWGDPMDEIWINHIGKAYPTKQDAREAMGFGVPITEE